MITTEFKTPMATIRIHDEYFEAAPDSRISQLSHIVSESYRRRQTQNRAAAALSYLADDGRTTV